MRYRNIFRIMLACLVASSTTLAHASEQKTRYMLEGIATPEVFAALIKSPEDRSINARGLMEKAGCELLDYYIGVHNYKSYIIIECGPEANLAALQLVVYGGGGVNEGTASEIVTAAELAEHAKAAGKLVESYKVPD